MTSAEGDIQGYVPSATHQVPNGAEAKMAALIRTMVILLFLALLTATKIASAVDFNVHARGHITRSQGPCPDGALLCGAASIKGYGNAEYRWYLVESGAPSGACGHRASFFDYNAIVTFMLLDGSTLMLQELGALCTPGKSFPTGGSNSYGNPQFFDASWKVLSSTGKFSGVIGQGTSKGTFAGAAVAIDYDGALNAGSNEATALFTWDIVLNGSPATCDDVGANRVRLVANGIQSTSLEFDCNQMSAAFAIATGTYTVEIQLIDINGVVLGSVPPHTVTIFPNDVTNLGLYTFAFAI